jgi:hypothetical protein
LKAKSPFNGTSLFDTVVGVVAGESAPLLHARPLQPVTEGLLAKKPADRLTGEQARMALLDIQQNEHQLFFRDVRLTRDGKQSSQLAGAQAVFVLRSCCCAIGLTGTLQR